MKNPSYKANPEGRGRIVKSLEINKNQEGIYECRGRIGGEYPVYIPAESILSQKNLFSAHKGTLHGEGTMTMTKVCCQYWIPT